MSRARPSHRGTAPTASFETTTARRARVAAGHDLDARLADLERAVELGEGLVSPEAMAPARAVLESADQRRRLAPGVVVVALLGATGSGKSTLARLLLRYADPDAGTVALGGVPLSEIDPSVLYSAIGAVFQDARLLRTSIAANIALADPDADRSRIRAAAEAAHIHERIEALPRGYDSVYGQDANLSGGQAQRVCIARTLLLDPRVLVLDEPTASADAESEHAIQLALASLLTPERTIVVIAHRLESIMSADQVIVFDSGRIVEQGEPGALVSSGGALAALLRDERTRRKPAAEPQEVSRAW